jgi:hypothetical protein
MSRAVIQDLLNSVGLRCESFGAAEEFLRSKRPHGTSCRITSEYAVTEKHV